MCFCLEKDVIEKYNNFNRYIYSNSFNDKIRSGADCKHDESLKKYCYRCKVGAVLFLLTLTLTLTLTHHDHVREQSRHINAERHVGNNSFYDLSFALHVSLNIDVFEQL